MKYLPGNSILVAIIFMAMTGCVSSPRFTMAKKTNVTPALNSTLSSMTMEEGIASYYAEEFNGRRTSNGEIYDMHAMTAAHRTLPFNSRVHVTNLESGKSVVVRINDRGPFKDERVIDLSLAAAKAIEMIGAGIAKVRVQVIELGDSTKQR